MKTFEMNANFSSYGCQLENFSQDEIRNEPQLFGATVEHAALKGGPITQEFLAKCQLTVEEMDQQPILDTRVHMLMPTWYPCIPGWHFDDLRRPGGPPNQPVWEEDNPGRHYLCVIGPTSMPEFAVGPTTLPQPDSNENTYEAYDKYLTTVKQPQSLCEVMSGELIYFKAHEGLHRGTPAKTFGWRIFLRLSYGVSWNRQPRDEIRTQTQVYIPQISKGW